MPTYAFWTNSRGALCTTVRKSYEPQSGQHTGKQERKRIQKLFASKCSGIYNLGGSWFRDRNNENLDEKIWVNGFPDQFFMGWVIAYAEKRGRDYVIPSEELDGVFAAAEEATSPEGLRHAEEERQRLKKERLEMEAEEEKQRELRREENRRREKERYEKSIKDEYAEEEAWWLEYSSGRMALLGF